MSAAMQAVYRERTVAQFERSTSVLRPTVSSDTITRLIGAGLATPVTETKKVPRGLMITVERIRITDDGRKALEA